MADDHNAGLAAELIDKVSPAYAIFRTAGPPAAPLVDLVVTEKLRIPPEFAGAGLLGAEALACWAASLAAARPDRKAMQVILDGFGSWWPRNPQAMAEFLPQIAPAAGDLEASGFEKLLAAGSTAAFRAAATYAMTTGEAIRAVTGLAARLPHRMDLLDALVAAFPAAKMEESRDAERFLPALESAVAAAGPAGEHALRFGIALVSHDPSSAFGACSALPKSISRVSEDRRAAYVEACARVAEAAGNRAAGFCLDQLPNLADPVGATSAACGVARDFGSVAAEHILKSLR